MYLLDANVLIYAFREDSPFHAPCRRWLEEVLSQGERIGTAEVVELAFLRINTLPSLGAKASPLPETFAFLRALKALPNWERVEPGPGHLGILQVLAEGLGLRGNDLNDAYLAALALERGAVLVSADKGFARFPGLLWLNPLEGA
ncbi:TA system VapC family ribonuclease toxin [Thermus oshimai]